MEQNSESSIFNREGSIFKSGLKQKTLFLTGALMLVAFVVQFALSYMFLTAAFEQKIASVERGFDTNIQTAVETLVGTLKANHQLYLEGEISKETALAVARRIVRDTRYNSNAAKGNDGYFWADMADGYCAVHYNPVNQGAMRWDWKDKEGTYYIRDFIRLGDAGGGYSNFYFGRLGDEQGAHKKRGYTLKFEPYGWYISTGNYYEDTDAIITGIQEMGRINLLSLLGASFAIIFIGLFLVSMNLNRVVTPIIKISNRVHLLSMGDTSSEFSDFTGKDEIGVLQKSVVNMISVLHELLENINTMIAEQERGNIEYRFNTDAFLGDYKRLAESVLVLADSGTKDPLTRIPNRRSYDNRLDLEWHRAIRDQTSISLLMIDVDRFKDYNDTYGHKQGDLALQAIAQILAQSVKRSIDFTARWGGEEFVVLLPGTNSPGAVDVAEQIRVAIENALIPCTNVKAAKVTVSIGVCARIPAQHDSMESLMDDADEALYRAKATGRNRVCLWEEGEAVTA